MGRKFQGRIILPASVEGEAVVSRLGFNTLACFYRTILNRAERAICGDLNNPELFGKDLTGKILCVPISWTSMEVRIPLLPVRYFSIENGPFIPSLFRNLKVGLSVGIFMDSGIVLRNAAAGQNGAGENGGSIRRAVHVR